MSTQPTPLDALMAKIDELVAHAREDDRLCYDQVPSQRYADFRDDVRAALAKWGTPATGGETAESAAVCAEAYQVIGCLLNDLGIFETEQAERILDNLSEARMAHKDVLPWITPTSVKPLGVVEHAGSQTSYINWTGKPPTHGTKLYTSPQPVREPLTPEQIKDEASYLGFIGSTEALVSFVRRIEAAHGIGITGGQRGTER